MNISSDCADDYEMRFEGIVAEYQSPAVPVHNHAR